MRMEGVEQEEDNCNLSALLSTLSLDDSLGNACAVLANRAGHLMATAY